MPATLRLQADAPRLAVLFAAGAGGDPRRHRGLLQTLAAHGCDVLAPQFERIAAPAPTLAELSLRSARLLAALEEVAVRGLPVAGIGHSIGATLLLGLAGGEIWTQAAEHLPSPRDARLGKLVLFAPPTRFFAAPGALAHVRVPVQAWAAAADTITPPSQVDFLAAHLQVERHLAAGAGHFSFMDELPPHVTDPLPDRPAFLAGVAAEVLRFLA
jgi:pimeloyl-ACP methyl ester carboxylesterase